MDTCLLLSPQSDLQFVLTPPLARCGLGLMQARNIRLADTGRHYEIVILDLRCPGGLGDTVCLDARRRWAGHILALVDQQGAIEKSLILEMGADALVTAPFFEDEIEVRIRSLRRRADRSCISARWHRDAPIESRAVLDTDARQLRLPGARRLDLSDSECAVLDALIAQPGRAMSRGELIASTGLSQGSRNPNLIDLAVSRLRRKLSMAGADESLIATVRGLGYAWTGQGCSTST